MFGAAADDVGLDVCKAEALRTNGFDEIGEAIIGDVAHAMRGRTKIDDFVYSILSF
jgi:hypothetical protein